MLHNCYVRTQRELDNDRILDPWDAEHKDAARQARLNLLASQFEWTSFDEKAAVGYGTLAALVHRSRASHARCKDNMIAGHAYSLGAALMTRNPKDFKLVETMVSIIAI